ncbi:MAG: VanZ family protein [Lachnospiraceae bacterium]|nr:VanZ family protein [Lachnospiraceae bacterium]
MRNYIIIAARGILVAAIIFWTMTIFGFSAEEGEVSQSTSDLITGKVIEIYVKEYEEMPTYRQEELWNQISFVVRKIGHFGEYEILAGLIFLLFMTFEKVRKNYKWLIADALFCLIYAVSDEIHQGFVAGRSARIRDVFIDTSGAITAIIISLCVWHFVLVKLFKAAE